LAATLAHARIPVFAWPTPDWYAVGAAVGVNGLLVPRTIGDGQYQFFAAAFARCHTP